jgi:hypothetical protein
MASTFSWLDQSDHQRRKVLDLLAMFKERETVDELGLGTIRDAFADLLFPGTSAPQTRARYFFFIPWMYLQFERRKTPSAEIARRARRFELDLIETLLEAGEEDGVIGRLARATLQRLPSNIYWSGLRRLGIFVGDGSQERYHASLDRFYERPRDMRTDDGDALGGYRGNWDRHLPGAPERFETTPTLALSQQEAEYLRMQIQLSAPESLFAVMMRDHKPPDEEFPWDNPTNPEHSPDIQRQLRHGRNFSEVMHGAALLYNLVLAELTKNRERQDEYRQAMSEWAARIQSRAPAFAGWDLTDLWRCVESEGARVGVPTKAFVTDWYRETMTAGPAVVADSKRARDLVERRERALKRRMARIDNQRARERWGGASGTGRLSYRWPNAARIATDIIQALNGKNNARTA